MGRTRAGGRPRDDEKEFMPILVRHHGVAGLFAAAAAALAAYWWSVRFQRRHRRLQLASHGVQSPRVVCSFTAKCTAPLTDLLRSELPTDFPSKNAMSQACKRRQLLIDGTPAANAKHVVMAGQRVEYVALPASKQVHRALLSKVKDAPVASLTLEWAYIDAYLAVCVKPRGFSVQGDASAAQLRQAVALALPPPAERPDPLPAPRHAHRIDKATGGLLVYARTRSAVAAISTAFGQKGAAGGDRAESGVVRKTYLALVCGRLEGEGVIDAPIHGKPSRSEWVSLSCVRSAASGWVTTLRLKPITGRQHQLRRHLALELGCPILGDPRFLSAEARAAELQGDLHLWAAGLELPHPATGAPLRVTADEPPHFEERRRAEEAAFAAVGDAEWRAAVAHAEERRRRAAEGAFRLVGAAQPTEAEGDCANE